MKVSIKLVVCELYVIQLMVILTVNIRFEIQIGEISRVGTKKIYDFLNSFNFYSFS